MKKYLCSFFALALCAMLFTNCDDKTKPDVNVTGVTLNKPTLSLAVGMKETLAATIAPETATNKNVTWSSSDPLKATVNATTGEVTAVAAGTTTITATSSADATKKATCAVTITSTTVAVTGVTLNKSTLSLAVGMKETLTATIAPETATNKNVTWSSSDPLKATVNATTGEVTAVAAGTTTITATSSADATKKATCAVTITSTTVAVTGVTLNKSTLSLAIGMKETLTATIAPETATNKNVTWSSSDPLKATVNATTGEVTAVAAGTTTITATSSADATKKATCAVTVPAPIENLFKNGDFSQFDNTKPTTLDKWYFEPTLVANVTPDWGKNGWSMETGNGTFLKTWGEGTDARKASTWTESLAIGTYTLTIKYKSSWEIWLNVEGVTNDPNKAFAELDGWVVDETNTFTTEVEVATAGAVTVKITVGAITEGEGWERYIDIYSLSLVKK